jgi:hypothetical protein
MPVVHHLPMLRRNKCVEARFKLVFLVFARAVLQSKSTPLLGTFSQPLSMFIFNVKFVLSKSVFVRELTDNIQPKSLTCHIVSILHLTGQTASFVFDYVEHLFALVLPFSDGNSVRTKKSTKRPQR